MESAMELITRDLRRDEDSQAQKHPAPVAPVAPKPLSASVQAGIAAGNINMSSSGDRMALGEASQAEVDRHNELLANFERRKQARQIAVSTDDTEVKAQLRELKEPICLFGEGPAERRDRLKDLLLRLGPAARKRLAEDPTEAAEREVQEIWYHEGGPELKSSRLDIAGYSLQRARDRLKVARLKLSRPDSESHPDRQRLHNKLRTYGNYSSQIGDTRPLTSCQLSPSSKLLATASWTGLCKIWSIPECEPVKVLRGHTNRVSAVRWHPQSGCGQDRSAINLVSSDVAGVVRCWSLESEEPIASLEGHEKRVAGLAFHPSGKYLGTTCYDHSWRLWDMEKKIELLHQEGHSRPVYGIAFHADGSLVGTCSLDAMGRIWDLRSGKCVLVLKGHVKELMGIDFSSNGYHVATGGEDHQVRLWDLRQRKSVYTMPAHKGLISSLKYQKDGELLVTASFDNTAKVWAMPACTQLKLLTGHEGRLMSVDIANDSEYIVTASHDSTFKLWAAE
eukprot:m.51760 g.51760  ORF g.51760 m.51760 type:complete len:507 (-) comp10752_c0_seq2:4539-6059(-)